MFEYNNYNYNNNLCNLNVMTFMYGMIKKPAKKMIQKKINEHIIILIKII